MYMMTNHLYNLIVQLVQESKTLSRIDIYLVDSQECEECQQFWQDMKIDKEKHVQALLELIKHHL